MDTKTKPRFMLDVVILCLFFKFCFSQGVETISEGFVLSGDSSAISAGGVFQLGFFKPGSAPNYYVGIWYVEDPSRTPVWVANREKPVSLSSELRISDGNLVLFDESKVPVWSTNVENNSLTPRSVQGILLDNGNLVLNDIGSNPPKPLWQSFDHPTDTWLPGSKISYNNITKRSQLFTSWKNSEDPAPGLFSLQLEPSDKSFRLLWNRSRTYWTSGPWNGHYFSLLPEMRVRYIFNFSFFSNQNESYFTYTLKNPYNSTRTRSTLTVSGQVKQLTWVAKNGWNSFWTQPMQQCKVYYLCGAYASCNDLSLPSCRCLTGFKPKMKSDWDLEDYSGGCMRSTNLQCGAVTLADGGRDKFLKMLNMSMPENNRSVRVGSSEECESRCLSNCSCTAYAYDRNGCSIWVGDLINLKQKGNDSGSTLYIRLAASEFQNPKNESGQSIQSKGSSRNWKLYSVLFGTIAAVVVISCTACYVYYLRRKRIANRQGESHITDFIGSGELKEDEKKGIEVPLFVLESILAATDNFSEANKLGRGGFGPVYKGKFPGGQEIAIKRLLSGSGQGLQEFKNEVLLIAKLQHRNLVRLLGYCVEGVEKMLLYEYMPNKSLDSFIFDQKLCALLNWEIRFNIILGIARGLHYLHHDSRLRVIHRDLKTSNVLLDEEMNPKISDFGLAKIFGGKQTEANTNRVVGTYGYMSPEYAIHGLFSVKSDVFSFGVVVLEILSGKRNTGFHQSELASSLLDYSWKLWRENKALDLMDQSLSETCNENEFLRCFNIGLLCVQDDPNDRPTMSNVLVMLGSESGNLPSPKQPAFVVKRPLSSRASSENPPSNNELTDTLNEGR